jgi:hypothetical protein
MPIQIRMMSWNIQKKQNNAAYIAAVMGGYRVDILALLEVPNGQTFNIPYGILAALNNSNHHPYEWQFKWVDVGDEAVAYIWHETNLAGQNAFRAATYPQTAEKVSGRVLKNANNAPIYFPTTKYNWASLPGTPDGRRPAYMLFSTNDNQGARTFSFLNMHAPDNTATSIQSYSAHLYATAREIVRVEAVDVAGMAALAWAPATSFVAQPVAALLTRITNSGSFIDPGKVRNASASEVMEGIRTGVGTGDGLVSLLSDAAQAGVDGAMDALGVIPTAISADDASLLARACATAAAGCATYMLAAAQLPTAPNNARADAPTAANAAMALVANTGSQYAAPQQNTAVRLRATIRAEARRMARAALATFDFAAVAQANVTAAVIAGDFNVPYPDQTDYTEHTSATQKLGNGVNAYTRLLAIGQARNAEATTRKGPTSFSKQHIYTLKAPCPIQWTNDQLDTYVPLNVSSLATTAVSFMGYEAWVRALEQLPRINNVSWAQLVSADRPFAQRISDAFDRSRPIDVTAFYRANCFDNMFVRGANVVQSGTVDVMSELGSWQGYTVPNPQPALAVNPWPAAAGNLNGIAQAQLSRNNAQLVFVYNTSTESVTYTITPGLSDALQAAVFLDRYISDHLPVMVEIQV